MMIIIATYSHIFVPVAIESAGTWNHQAVELVQELGRRMTAITEDTREATYLFQRMSLALQRGNAVSFQFPQHFHHRVNAAVVLLAYFSIFYTLGNLVPRV